MKNAEELYQYCKKNLHTKKWIAYIKWQAKICLKDEVPRCNGSYYGSRRIENDYAGELDLILENECKVKSYREDVFIAVNKIFQDIADELTNELSLWIPYKVVLYARNSYEAVLWIGPSQCAEKFLKVYIQSGYDAARASL
ncbi:MAG: hypothetical protein NC433_07815 [Clostridiales bacterium]|nr:hypothetical protein [Clostridiales bacterium]